MLARIQPEGGVLQLATDHEDYSAWMLEKVLSHPNYAWTARVASDWQNPPTDWVKTRYQRKTSEEGRPPLFIHCRRSA
jgi:tRNA (guanine-N7-)-methyltransferase